MSRWSRLHTFSVVWVLALFVTHASAQEKTARPNVIVLMSDQQRWDTLGCYGQKLAISPNLDEMAKEGVRFEYAFTNQPVSGPARAVLNTGRYASQTGVLRNHMRLPPDEKTAADYLSELGYQTAFVGDWHLGRGKQPVTADSRGGFKDYWFASNELELTSHSYDGVIYDASLQPVELNCYRADFVTDLALDFIRKRDPTRPFLLHVYYVEPHHQNDHKHFDGPTGSKEKWKDFEVPGDLAGTTGDWREEMPDYLGCCAALDADVGRIRAELEKQGIAGNTIVMYTSDHGCHFRTRNREYKRCPHDAASRVPLIICGPGFEGAKIVRELVSLIDIAPTTLAAVGINRPPEMQGHALQDLVNGKVAHWPKEVFIQTSESETARAIRTDRWLYGVAAQDPSGKEQLAYSEKYLYDMENDPDQRSNLTGDPGYSDVRSKLAGILKRYIVETGERPPQILPQR